MHYIFRTQIRSALLLLTPALLFAAVFLIYPLLKGIYISFTNASPLRPVQKFVGFENYAYLLSSPEFYLVLMNSVLLVGGAILISTIVGLGFALLVNQRLPGTTFFRAGVFQIWIVPWISVAILWGWIFNSDYGIVNFILINFGVITEKVSWFSESATARLVIVLGFAWRMIPFMMVITLAALQSINKEILEAADVDRATPLQSFFTITLPLLRPMLITLALLQLVKLFQEITLPWVLTQGGPVSSTTTLGLYTYKLAFQQWDYALAAATGVLWLVLLGLIGLIALLLTGRHYE